MQDWYKERQRARRIRRLTRREHAKAMQTLTSFQELMATIGQELTQEHQTRETLH